MTTTRPLFHSVSENCTILHCIREFATKRFVNSSCMFSFRQSFSSCGYLNYCNQVCCRDRGTPPPLCYPNQICYLSKMYRTRLNVCIRNSFQREKLSNDTLRLSYFACRKIPKGDRKTLPLDPTSQKYPSQKNNTSPNAYLNPPPHSPRLHWLVPPLNI